VTNRDRLLWIAGLDPGESTGLLVLQLTSAGGVSTHTRYQGPPSEALQRLEAVVRSAALWRQDVLIAGERFTVTDKTGKRTSQPTPLKVLGMAEQLSYEYANVEFTLQSPADAKKLVPNVRLREIGFYTSADLVGRPDANDVNDAARHALLGLMRRKASVFDALLLAADRRRTESQR
jgi:hypothetical protein